MTKIEKVILALLISSASVMASFISPELAMLKEFFSLKNNQLSQIMTCYLAGYVSAQIVWAGVSNRIGRLNTIKCGIVISIFGAIFILVAMQIREFNLFLTGRIFVAFGLASGLVCGFATIKESLSAHESKPYLSIIAIVFTTSIYLSMLVSGYLAKYTSLNFVMHTILFYNTTMLFLCFCIKIKNHARSTVSKQTLSLMNLKAQPKVIAFSFVLSITTIIAYSYALYAPIITHELFFFSPKEFGIFSLINMIFILLGSALYLKLVRKLPEYKILLYGLLLILTVCFFFLLMTGFSIQPCAVSFFILCALLNLSSGMIYPAATYKALEYGECKATSSATMNVIKLMMPIVALYASSHFLKNEITTFVSTILLFAMLFFLILLLTKIRLPQLTASEIE